MLYYNHQIEYYIIEIKDRLLKNTWPAWKQGTVICRSFRDRNSLGATKHKLTDNKMIYYYDKMISLFFSINNICMYLNRNVYHWPLESEIHAEEKAIISSNNNQYSSYSLVLFYHGHIKLYGDQRYQHTYMCQNFSLIVIKELYRNNQMLAILAGINLVSEYVF